MLLLAPGVSVAQDGALQHLETRLTKATGRQRLELLVDLVQLRTTSDPARAIAAGHEAFDLLDSSPDRALELRLLNHLAQAHFEHQDQHRALHHAEQAEQLARARGDRHQLAAALDLIGDVHRSLVDYTRSLELTNQAIELYQQLGERRLLANALNDAGLAYRRIGNYSEAVRVYLRCRRIRKKLGDRPALARSLNNLGVVYRRLGQNDEALEVYQQALEIQEQEGNLPQVARLLNNIGIVYKLEGEIARAVEHYRRSLTIKEELGDKAGIASTLNNLGLAYEDLGDLERAAADYRRSLEIKESIGERQRVAETLVRLASIHRRREEPNMALEMVDKAMAAARETHDQENLRDAYRELSDIHAAARRDQQAWSAFESYKSIKNQILKQVNSEAVTAMRIRFESDRKDKEVALLTQQQELAAVELRQQEMTRRALYASLSLSVLAVLLLASRSRLRVRSARTIARQNRKLEQTLAELRESEQRYRRLFDEPGLAKLLLDPASGEIVDVNDSAAEILGRAPDEVTGRGVASLGCSWLSSIADQIDGGEERNQPVWVGQFQPHGGRGRSFEAWAGHLALGGRWVALVTLYDVTEHRRLEEEKLRREEHERYLAELEARKAEVEARNAELERFVYVVSHDLKAPLVTICGFVGLMEKDALAGDLKRVRVDIERIHAASGKMLTFLDELLELSRSGQVIESPQEVVLAEVARETVQMMAGELSERDIAVHVADDLPVAQGDRRRILEIFQNLLDNAVKYLGDQEAPCLELGWRRQAEPVYFVRDNGIGLAPSEHLRIFDLFDRGSEERLGQKVEGAGVGLAVVKRIVEVHGGKIWVESDGEGQGSTFCFTLPSGG